MEMLSTSEAAMRLILFGILVALTPSVLAVAWLLWQSDGLEEQTGLDPDLGT